MKERRRIYIAAFGVNHESADLEDRERFYLSENEYKDFLKTLSFNKITNVFVLNTCNRTEIYTESDVLQQVISIYKAIKKIDNELLHNYTFIKYDNAAVKHLFEVGAGLKSKILGDYQIIGQIRTAFNEAKAHKLIDSTFERLFQSLFIACKEINNTTLFNQGSASHGYQVASILNKLNLPTQSKILLLGAGDMAQKTLNHLLDYSSHSITIVNRSYNKLANFEGLNKVNISWLENLPYLIQQHQIIISTIPIENYIVEGQAAQLQGKVIFDLTVPSSIASLFRTGENTVFDIEAIEKHTQETIAIRSQEISKVEEIISQHIQAFYKWRSTNLQNNVFRLFEKELELLLQKREKHEVNSEDNELNPQKITQLFMKNYYSKLANQKAV